MKWPTRRRRAARHRDQIVPEGQYRLVRLTDLPRSDFIGTRAWCDGTLSPCPQCGECCACQHTEKPLPH